jgi:anti-anti-sigma factor
LPDDFSIDVLRASGVDVVTVHGELDMVTAPLLTTRVKKLYDDGAVSVVVDLDGVSFLSSAGLAALVHSQEEAVRLRRDWAVVTEQRSTLRTIEITGLAEQLAPYDSIGTVLSIASEHLPSA